MAEAGAAALAGRDRAAVRGGVDRRPASGCWSSAPTAARARSRSSCAWRAGATVVAPALEIDDAYLHGLGVSELVERGEQPPADAVIDFVGTEPFAERYVSPLGGDRAVSDPSAVARLGGADRRARA